MFAHVPIAQPPAVGRLKSVATSCKGQQRAREQDRRCDYEHFDDAKPLPWLGLGEEAGTPSANEEGTLAKQCTRQTCRDTDQREGRQLPGFEVGRGVGELDEAGQKKILPEAVLHRLRDHRRDRAAEKSPPGQLRRPVGRDLFEAEEYPPNWRTKGCSEGQGRADGDKLALRAVPREPPRHPQPAAEEPEAPARYPTGDDGTDVGDERALRAGEEPRGGHQHQRERPCQPRPER